MKFVKSSGSSEYFLKALEVGESYGPAGCSAEVISVVNATCLCASGNKAALPHHKCFSVIILTK